MLLVDLISNATGTWRDLYRSSQVSGPWRRRAFDSRDRDRSGERRAAVVDSEPGIRGILPGLCNYMGMSENGVYPQL